MQGTSWAADTYSQNQETPRFHENPMFNTVSTLNPILKRFNTAYIFMSFRQIQAKYIKQAMITHAIPSLIHSHPPISNFEKVSLRKHN